MSECVVAVHVPPRNPGEALLPVTAPSATTVKANTSDYTDEVVADLKVVLLGRVERIAAAGGTLPPTEDLARLLSRALPDVPEDLDPHFADLAPFHDSAGARNQLGGVSKQALAGRRQTGSVLAMRSGDGKLRTGHHPGPVAPEMPP